MTPQTWHRGVPNNSLKLPRMRTMNMNYFPQQTNYSSGPLLIDGPVHTVNKIMPGEAIGMAAHRIFGSNTIANRHRVRRLPR